MKHFPNLNLRILIMIAILSSIAISSHSQDIYEAVKSNDLTKVKVLVIADPQVVNARDNTGRTSLHWACRGVHFEIVKYLVENGANVNSLDNNGIAALFSLITRAHIDGINFLINNNADVNIKSPQDDTPLHYAAMSGNTEVIKILLKRGAMPSASNKSGYTPLVYAANGGFKEAVNLLLDNGADYDRTGDKALEVLMLSMGNGLERLAQVVIEKDGTDLLNDELRNREIMHEAVKSGSVEIVELLIANDVRLEKGVDKYGWTPIHYAVKEGRLVMVEFLAENGVNINTRAFPGESAYNMAESAGNKELQDIIIKQGGNKEPKKLPKNRSPYLGQKVPGNTPELFAPGLVSTAAHEFSSCFSPDGKEFYFTRRQPALNYAVVMYSKLVDGAWTEPEMVPFVEGQFSFEPFVTPDNKRLFFQMGKAVNGGLHMYTMYVDRTPEGWGEVQDPGDVFNPDKTMHVSASLNGTIYTTDISGGLTSNVNGVISEAGRECMGMIRKVNDEYQKIEQLGPPLNAMKQSQHPWISPDESYMLFSVRRPGQEIESALFYANRKSDGKWSEPKEINLGIDVSQPFITYDGKYLFFTSGDQKSDIYWVSTKIIRELKPNE